MNKIINPCKTEDGEVFIKITIENKNKDKEIPKYVLSISGVIGPLKNGDARGSCGQIIMSFNDYYKPENIIYHSGWNNRKLQAFF